MREIKFRGKHINTGEWVYGFFTTYSGRAYIKSPEVGQRFGCGIEVDPETVGQFTGLKDKNGKEIYEGDIVRIGDDLIEEITWVDETNWHADKCPVNGWVNHESIYRLRPEIIGNVHDSIELLEAK